MLHTLDGIVLDEELDVGSDEELESLAGFRRKARHAIRPHRSRQLSDLRRAAL